MTTYDIPISGSLKCGEVMCSRRLCRTLAGLPFKRRHKTLQRGDQFDFQDGSQTKIWIILRGVTAICTGLTDGRRQIIGLETPGHIVCGMAVGIRSETWFEALSETVLCEIDLQAAGPMTTHGTLSCDGRRLFVELLGIIHERLETYSAHLVTLGRLDSTERVTLFLLDMAHRMGRTCDSSIFFELPMTREDIADYLGLNTETVSRIFTRLKKSKLVLFPSRSAVSIPDTAALERRLPLSAQTTSLSNPVDTFLSAFKAFPSAQDGAHP